MSDIEKKISLKGLDQVLSDFQKLQNEVSELKNRNRELRQTSEGNASETMSELKGMAAQYLSVGAAIGIVTQGIAEHRAENERVGKIYDDNNQKLLQTLALTNQIANGSQVEAFVKSQPDRQQAMAALSGVMAGAPNMNQAEQFRITSALQPLAPVIGGEQMTKLGTLAASLGRIGITGNPEDVAMLATADAGGNADQLSHPRFLRNVGNMVKMGMDPNAAMALGTMSLNEDLGPKWAGQLVDSLVMDEEAKPDDSPLRKSFLRDKNSGSRLSSLLSNPRMAKEIMGATKALEMGRFDVGRLQAKTMEYETADLVPDRRRDLAMQMPAGADVITEREILAENEKYSDESGAILDPWSDAASRLREYRGRKASRSPWTSITGLNFLEGQAVEASMGVSRLSGGNVSSWAESYVGNLARSPLAGSPAEQDSLKRLIDALEKQNTFNKEQADALRQKVAPAPSRSIHGE